MMNPEDLGKLIDEVARQAEQQGDTFEIEAYIGKVAVAASESVSSILDSRRHGIPEPTKSRLARWVVSNGSRFSLQVGAVVELMLRKELLGE